LEVEVPVASRSTSQPPLTLTEAAAHLNVRPRFMRRLVAERRLPYHKVGALLRFRLEDLDAYFTSRRVEASSAVRRRSA
jgi:excisionase family DNA binding protein